MPAEGDLSADAYLELRAEERCKIVHRDNLVITLRGPARALAMPHGELAVLLREGTLDVDLAAGAVTAESGFWLSTPSTRIELVGGARVAVRAHASGRAHLYVVSGQVRVLALRRGAKPLELGAGHGLDVSNDGLATPVDARLERLEDALAWLGAVKARAADPGPAVEALVALTDETFAQVAAARASLDALTRDHEQRVASGGQGAMDLQRQIATESGKQLTIERRLSAQAAALEAWTIDPGLPGRDAVLALLGRVHANQ